VPTLAGSPLLPSPAKNGWLAVQGEQLSAATTLCAIVNTSAREALSEELKVVEGGREMEGVRTEKEGAESSTRVCARVPISQLGIKVQYKVGLEV
jgi:hypothetical protein